MKSRLSRALLLGGCLFGMGAVFLLLWVEGRAGVYLGVGLGAVCASALVLWIAGRWVAKRGDPLRARRERRLWSSGPLGRWWLGRKHRRP